MTIHPRYIQFTNAEIVERDPLHRQLGELADFLWNDPRPHEEGKFEMADVATGWNQYIDDPCEALNQCGTAACACGWEALRSGDLDLYSTIADNLGVDTNWWMFGGGWSILDSSPFGASFRIDHYLKHRDPLLYSGEIYIDQARHYPADAFWMEA